MMQIFFANGGELSNATLGNARIVSRGGRLVDLEEDPGLSFVAEETLILRH